MNIYKIFFSGTTRQCSMVHNHENGFISSSAMLFLHFSKIRKKISPRIHDSASLQVQFLFCTMAFCVYTHELTDAQK